MVALLPRMMASSTRSTQVRSRPLKDTTGRSPQYNRLAVWSGSARVRGPHRGLGAQCEREGDRADARPTVAGSPPGLTVVGLSCAAVFPRFLLCQFWPIAGAPAGLELDLAYSSECRRLLVGISSGRRLAARLAPCAPRRHLLRCRAARGVGSGQSAGRGRSGCTCYGWAWGRRPPRDARRLVQPVDPITRSRGAKIADLLRARRGQCLTLVLLARILPTRHIQPLLRFSYHTLQTPGHLVAASQLTGVPADLSFVLAFLLALLARVPLSPALIPTLTDTRPHTPPCPHICCLSLC